ncbi:hypothetical protein LZ32DRAFT_602800 [Colletotrichum eremochloae]|nr:hypothetical protein LZ32DRAFT_602800 [Colletotrichum eremochloae]
MQFSVALVALFAGAAIAVPTGSTTYDPCSGLYDSVQCCATDVLGLANLDCNVPTTLPTSPDHFKRVCAATGKRARCCVLPALGLGVLCQNPVGIQG